MYLGHTEYIKMQTYSKAFDEAASHLMLYEVGGFWKLTSEVELGLCSTPQQKKNTGYVNDPLDAGGETKFGIAKNSNKGVNIKSMTWAQAKQIYFEKYWLASSCDKMAAPLAIMVFDSAANHGVTKTVKFLQRSLGILDDGNLGPITLSKILASDQRSLSLKVADTRAQFYKDIVASNPSQAKFLKGWTRRITEMRSFVTAFKE